MKNYSLFFIALFLLGLSNKAAAYDVQYGNYYFNRLNLTKTQDVGGVMTYYYNVEATSKEGGYSGFSQTYSGPIAPPATFIVHSSSNETYVYTLTRIADMAFANNASATELTIPETVTEISDMGLLVNMELTKVTCLAKSPPIHNSYYLLFIQSVTDDATLYVPNGYKSAYQSASGWREFRNIVELAPSLGGHEYVDLGLPSGKLWSTMNYGATKTTGYGNYLEWYSLNEISNNWGSDWGAPTISEYAELVNYCTWTWTSQGGVNGYRIQGRNNNEMFLPAAGFQISGYPQMVGSGIYYWSETAGSGGFSYMLSGSSSSVNTYSTYNASIMSAPVRPIVRGVVDVTPVYLTIKYTEGVKMKQRVTPGKSFTYKIEPTGNKHIKWVKFNGTDVTSQVVNGEYTTPAINNDSMLEISFE